ncbi:MAG: aspartate aminotransferase family protein [Candidatus Omnitrophica bacterium]|nr:aspartate aminotransferase family protein [Candidatus Omnitrophota bacterium]
MKLAEVFDIYNEFIVPSYSKVPVVFVKGKGSYLWDIHAKKYLDFFPGWGAVNVGHCHPRVMNAVRDQIAKLIFVPNNYYHLPQAKLARQLARLTQNKFKAFFCNSGAEANEAAIKLTRKFGRGRFEIITFENSFHGRTLATLSATGQRKYQEGFAPLLPGFKIVPFNDLGKTKQAISDQTVAIMLELIQGEGGINVADRQFVKEIRQLCDQHKLLLIIDEVQTGIGRTGTFFCWQQFEIEPDIFTLAKSLGGGLPIGCMLAKKEYADLLTAGSHASTFGGGPVICRAALAVLEALKKDKMLKNTIIQGEYLLKRLQELRSRYPNLIKEVRGMGLMLGIELYKSGKEIVELCRQKGLLINCTHETVLRIMPSLTVTRRQINQAVLILDSVLAEVNQ